MEHSNQYFNLKIRFFKTVLKFGDRDRSDISYLLDTNIESLIYIFLFILKFFSSDKTQVFRSKSIFLLLIFSIFCEQILIYSLIQKHFFIHF